MPKIIISRRAALDIYEIEQTSIKKWGQKTADSYITNIDEALQTLEEYPSLLKNFGSSEILSFYPIREHSLFCTISNDAIYLLTVKYGGMDLSNIIQSLEPTLIDEVKIMQSRL